MGPDEAGGIAYHFVLVVFSARYRTGTVKAGSDAADAAWIARDKLRTVGLNESTKPYVTLPAPGNA
jgi:hypothetical protein